ncbi:MAG: hypothetical protein RKP20_00855 [Candidatus Competibacter sp.]|nr:hypothetical protein [Candidatus Competibacter sp.]
MNRHSFSVTVQPPHPNPPPLGGRALPFYIFLAALLGGLAAFDAGAITESNTLPLSEEATVVALDGDTLVVGAPHAAIAGAQQAGRAFVVLRQGTNWTQQAELLPSPDNRAAFDEFGSAVAVAGDTVVVGARRQNSDRGAAYVFVRSGATWTQQAQLIASDGAAGHGFGAAVAISGDTAVIGAGGANASYVFKRVGATWTQQPRLAANDGATGDSFGCAVAVSGDSALIGAPSKTTGAGAAYLFKSAGGDWNSPQQTKLTAGGGANAYLGYAVDLSGRVALLGAPGETGNTGAGYVFFSNGTTWTQQARLAAASGAAGDRLGRTVNLGGEQADVALLGAPGASTTKGAAHLFARQGTAWTASASDPLTASAGASNDALGRGVALFGDTAVAVAPGAADAYVYRFDCGFGRDWTAGVWLFGGLPCNPNPNTVQGQFGDNFNPANYGTTKRWIVYDWNENTKAFVALGLTAPSLAQGAGFQHKTLDGARADVTGLATTPIPSAQCPSTVGCFEIPLVAPTGSETNRANLVGHPFPYPVDWADVRFVHNGTAYTPTDAATANLAYKNFKRYNGNAYESYDDLTPGMGGNLWPHESVWVYVKPGATALGIKLLIPAQPSRQNAAVPPDSPARFARLERLLGWLIPAAEAKPEDDAKAAARDARRKQHRDAIARGEAWYVRLIVETADGQFADPANVLGQLADADDGYDECDLDEPPPLADGPTLSLIFPHSNWKTAAGDYSSDYHRLNKNKGDRWTFEVRGNQKGTLRLRWQASSPEALARGQLVDEETGAVIAAAGTDHYEFALNGPTRAFRWDYFANSGKPPK